MTQQEIEDIKIADIEKELSALWEEHKGSNRVRACLFNLVVYSSEPRRRAYLEEIVESLVSKFPCRIIFIQTDDNQGANKLHVQVSNEVVGKGANSISCDHIQIDASPSQMHRVPFIVLPHLVPDLPTHLLWGQNPTTEKVILPHLLPACTRLIFDSDCTDNLPKFSQEMLAMIQAKPELEFIDLNWIRTRGWRQVVRNVFESSTANQKLQFNKDIQICYNSKKADCVRHLELQAIYLAAWIIRQMKWKWISQCHEDGVRRINCNNGSNDFAITLSPQVHEEFNPGAVVDVEVASTDNHFFFISPMENLPKAVVHISSLETCELPFSLPLPGLKKGSLSMTDVIFAQTSTHYRNMLALLKDQSNSCLIGNT